VTTESTAAEVPTKTLDEKTLLARVNARLSLLRAWLSHHHGDEPYWWARRTTAREIQRERWHLRYAATLLHVYKATSRGRVHGSYFANLDEQKAWLDKQLDRKACDEGVRYAGVPPQATLRLLLEGKLPL
jgi:hypothetical protein